MSAKEDPNEDLCGVCDSGGALICCDNCPLAFHAECIGYQNLDFIGEDEPWYCWACSRQKKRRFLRDSRPITMPSVGDEMYVAIDDTCKEYALFTVENSLSAGNKVRITNASTKESEIIKLSSPRIWKGTTAKGTFVKSGTKFSPKFYDIAIDLSKKTEIKKFLDSRKGKDAPKVKAAEGPKKMGQAQQPAEEPLSGSRQSNQETSKSQGKRKQSLAESSGIPSKQAKVHKSTALKETSKSPMSERGAAAVLSGLAKIASKKAPQKPKTVNPIKSWSALQITDATRKLADGDGVEIWVDATPTCPGGWVAGTVCNVCILESGASAPYFAFILVRFDSFAVAFEGIIYREWRPLAIQAPSRDAPAYQMQIRTPHAQRKQTSFARGDRVEALVDSVWCPGVIYSIQEKLCTIRFDCPSLNRKHREEEHSLTVVRMAHGLEDQFCGMLEEIRPDASS